MRRFFAATAILFSVCLAAGLAQAQTREPRAKEISAIRDCVKAKADIEDGGESCMFKLVAEPCMTTDFGRSNLGNANCYRIEQAIWDRILNENYKALQDVLDDEQKTKLREMQRAWIASRDRTCAFYWDKARGSMAVPMSAACQLRETARRALLLQFFSEL